MFNYFSIQHDGNYLYLYNILHKMTLSECIYMLYKFDLDIMGVLFLINLKLDIARRH